MADQVQAWDLARLEAAVDVLPRLRFAHLPTPLEQCRHVSKALGVRLTIKRDDCTGLALGGNKIRQHEFMVADAQQSNADCLIHGAAWQSNQSVQIAAVGAKLGMDVFLTPKQDLGSTALQGNSLLAHMLTSNITPIPEYESSIRAKNELAGELRAKGRRPYIVGMGSERSADMAAVAYIACLIEILHAWKESEPPTWIFVTSAGSTLVGLDLGCRILGFGTRVVGISPCGSDHESFRAHEALVAQAERVSHLLGWMGDPHACEFKRELRYVGERYGEVTDSAREAILMMARSEGILLDPVYTGKGFAAVLDYCRSGPVRSEDSVIFVHTGGLGGLFAHGDAFASRGEDRE